MRNLLKEGKQEKVKKNCCNYILEGKRREEK